MVSIKRPIKIFSFGDFSKTQPREQHPGDRLDAQFHELAEAIRTTQDALAEIRRDDGQLKRIVTKDQLQHGLVGEVTDAIVAAAQPVRAMLFETINTLTTTEQNVALYAKDAEAAVAVAQQLVNGLAALREQIHTKATRTSADAEVTAMLTTEAENWANYSHAQADNAAGARDEAVMWAEYLAGPVVDASQAPAYIAGSPIGNGLYYQPVEGGIAGLWSAKWWALQAYNLVGAAGAFFLGPWPAGPLPGEQNPSTGQVAPSPIPPGSIYYDTTKGMIMVWDGAQWQHAVGLLAPAQVAHFVYTVAVDGKQDFSGVDDNGLTPVVGSYPSDAYINGIRLVQNLDYSVNNTTNTLHVSTPLPIGSVLMWDLLMQPGTPTALVSAWKIDVLVPNGTAQDFTLKYTSGASHLDANVGKSSELQVVLDGTPQEPGTDFTASGNTLHLAVAPGADADLWAVWYQAV